MLFSDGLDRRRRLPSLKWCHPKILQNFAFSKGVMTHDFDQKFKMCFELFFFKVGVDMLFGDVLDGREGCPDKEISS